MSTPMPSRWLAPSHCASWPPERALDTSLSRHFRPRMCPKQRLTQYSLASKRRVWSTTLRSPLIGSPPGSSVGTSPAGSSGESCKRKVSSRVRSTVRLIMSISTQNSGRLVTWSSASERLWMGYRATCSIDDWPGCSGGADSMPASLLGC